MAKKKPAPDPVLIEVSFKPNIRTDGELAQVTIRQGTDEIHLTHEQARSLVLAISARCSL